MAIYRCEFKIYSRGKAHSAVAASAYVSGTAQKSRGGNSGKVSVKTVSAVEAAAYRSSERLMDNGSGHNHDYQGKHDVVWKGILAPANAPAWAKDRGRLWNEVERKEDTSTRPQTAQLFRECLLTLPRGLSRAQQIALVRSYVQDQFVDAGMVADIGIHCPKASDGGEQPHAHIMLTLRDIGPEGFGKKRRDWNDVEFRKGVAFKENAEKKRKDGSPHVDGLLRRSRSAWETYCNAALADAGSADRLDHRSLKERKIDRVPQPKLGKAHHARPAPWVENVRSNLTGVLFGNRSRALARAAGQSPARSSAEISADMAPADSFTAQVHMMRRAVRAASRQNSQRHASDGVAHALETARLLRGEALQPLTDRVPGHDR